MELLNIGVNTKTSFEGRKKGEFAESKSFGGSGAKRGKVLTSVSVSRGIASKR
jgi:hypothetical protein